MDLEYVLKWTVGLGSLFALATQVKQWPKAKGWVYVLSGLLGLLALGVLLEWSKTGYVLGVLWLVLAALPMSASRRQFELLTQNRIGEAAFWARVNAWLHPFDGLPDQARWFRAQAHIHSGELDSARELLAQLGSRPRFRELAKLESLKLDGDFTAIVEHVESRPVGTRDLALLPIYLEALGETGNIDQMLSWYSKLPITLRSQPLICLRLLAYTGQSTLIETLLDTLELNLPSHVTDYLRAIAYQAHGEPLAARPFLERVELHGAYQRQALKRLRRPLAKVEPHSLSDTARALLAELEQRGARLQDRHQIQRLKPWATWALAVALLGVFLACIPGGTLDHENLVKMGALILPEELAPGSWRLLTAGFVHLGATHLAMNVLALLFLGSALERSWGHLPLVACFSSGSVGAYWLATRLLEASHSEPKVLLGASAGVFGLVGALLTFEVLGSIYGRSKLFSRRLLVLAFLVLAQLVFDWFTPIVSSFLHLGGIAFGVVAALPLAVRAWHQRLE